MNMFPLARRAYYFKRACAALAFAIELRDRSRHGEITSRAKNRKMMREVALSWRLLADL